MAVFNEPQKWAQTLGKDADVVSIPDTASETEPSIDKIFPSVYSVPLARGGKAIPRSVLNGLFKLLGDWCFYQQNGGVASYSSAFDYAVGSFVKYNNQLYICIQANGASTTIKTPTDSAYWLRITTTADSPTGEIKIWPSSTIPDSFLLCNGSAVSRTTYANLFSEIGTTFGVGDGSTTFNIPDLRDHYIIGANTNALGAKIAEQLPNIRGATSVRKLTYTSGSNFNPILQGSTGAFSNRDGTDSIGTAGGGQGSSVPTILDLSLNRTNSIYTDNGHVYPLSLALNFIIKT